MELNEEQLIDNAADSDESAVGQLLMLHSQRLKRMIAARINARLRARLDASDVLQEVHVDVIQRLPEYLSNRQVPFFVWLRFLTSQKLVELDRRHLHTQARDARREQQTSPAERHDPTINMVEFLIGNVSSPSLQVHRQEVRKILNEAIASLDELDRTIISLRHVEQLTSVEAAAELNLSTNTCRQRHLRALKRLKAILEQNALCWSNNHGT